MHMPYRIAGIDVHKAMLAVVVADVEFEGDWQCERRRFGASPSELRLLTEWLVEHEVEEVVMESTAQYWRPVWDTLERDWQPTRRTRADAGASTGALHLAQAQSNHGPHGRKRDFPDGERLVKRLVAHELTLSFVPDVTQRLWRTVTRRKYQLTRNRVQLQNRLESILEEAHIKVSSLVSDLLGSSAAHAPRGCRRRDGSRHGRRTRQSPAPPRPSSYAMRSAPRRICILLYRRLITMTLAELEVIEAHMQQFDEELAGLLRVHQDAVQRLAAVPGLGIDSAQQIIAEVDPTARSFPRPSARPPGWAHVRGTTRAPALTTVTDRPTQACWSVASSWRPRRSGIRDRAAAVSG
jgi:transposase